MKKIIIYGVFALANILDSRIVQAQGTMTYLSNLDQASVGSLAVGSNSWWAAPFETGSNPSGYVLNSVLLGMADASGTPSGFTVFLFSAASGTGPWWLPNFNLGTFSGSLDPTTAGIYTFTAISNFMLSPFRTYFIVVTAGTSVANGEYNWSYTGATNYSSIENWSSSVEQTGASTSSDGSPPHPIWGIVPGDYAQLAINATAIPEPGVLGLFGLGGLAFLWHRRKAKAVQ